MATENLGFRIVTKSLLTNGDASRDSLGWMYPAGIGISPPALPPSHPPPSRGTRAATYNEANIISLVRG